MKTAPRAQDVADLAEVSQSAVSRTFTPGASVSEETRRKPDHAAQPHRGAGDELSGEPVLPPGDRKAAAKAAERGLSRADVHRGSR
ncbi:hypothetical protein G6F63_016666 [Rhizopus arrhizus]|nr:hypothetical protein G6F63_016666 [Rhizopus arrhizus]